MKLITLNIWGGRAGEEKVIEFFKKYNNTVDIFCLQEVWSAPHPHLDDRPVLGGKLSDMNAMEYALRDLSKILENYTPYFRPSMGEDYGLLTFVKKDIEVLEEGEKFVYKEKGYIPDGDLGNHARNIQYVHFAYNGKKFCVINFHGLWNGNGKTDSEDRIVQSKKVIEFINLHKDKEIIFCGDFNLLPETESIKIFEDLGLLNLIKKFDIQSTRTSYYTKPEKFADYIFTSAIVEIKDFRVMDEEISDHVPLLLEFY